MKVLKTNELMQLLLDEPGKFTFAQERTQDKIQLAVIERQGIHIEVNTTRQHLEEYWASKQK